MSPPPTSADYDYMGRTHDPLPDEDREEVEEPAGSVGDVGVSRRRISVGAGLCGPGRPGGHEGTWAPTDDVSCRRPVPDANQDTPGHPAVVLAVCHIVSVHHLASASSLSA